MLRFVIGESNERCDCNIERMCEKVLTTEHTENTKKLTAKSAKHVKISLANFACFAVQKYSSSHPV